MNSDRVRTSDAVAGRNGRDAVALGHRQVCIGSDSIRVAGAVVARIAVRRRTADGGRVGLRSGRRCREDGFFNDTATPEIYTLSLHDALPISATRSATTL